MRQRTVLILSSQRVLVDLIVRQLGGEFDDLKMICSSSVSHTLHLLEKHSFDIAICCNRLITQRLFHIFNKEDTAIIVLKRNRFEAIYAPLREHNVGQLYLNESWSHRLFTLFRSRCNPKLFRQEARFHIPSLTAELAVAHFRAKAEVLNVNSHAFLVDFDYRPEFAGLLNGLCATLNFPVHYPHKTLGPVEGAVLRIHILETCKSGIPRRIRMVVLMRQLTDEQQKHLNNNLDQAARETANYEEQVEPDEQVYIASGE